MAKWRGTIISFLLGCGLIAVVGVWQASFAEDSLSGTLTAWSNACFAVAVLWCGIGLLVWISAFGGFQALGYLSRVFRKKWSKAAQEKYKNQNSYYDYMEERRKNAKKAPSTALMLPGGIYLAAAIALTVAYTLV